MTFRLGEERRQRLRQMAKERNVSATANLLATNAIDYYLDRLIPVDEIVLTREPSR